MVIEKSKFLQNAFIRVQDFLFDPANFKKLIIGVVVLISIFVVRRIFFPPSPDLSKTKSAEESEKSDLVPVKVFKVGRFNFEDSLNSLGTMKVVRYLFEGEYRNKIDELILLSPFDKKGAMISSGRKNIEGLLNKAQTMIDEGKMFEHADVYGRLYGSRMSDVEAITSTGNDVLFVIDVQGARKVKRDHPEAVTIFIDAATTEELVARMEARDKGAAERAYGEECDHRVVNPQGALVETVRKVGEIMNRQD